MDASKTFAFCTSPQSGKFRFKLRTLNNFLLAIAIFVPLSFVFVRMWAEKIEVAWLADVALITLLFYLYRIFWNKRAIWICCPKCWEKIATNTPWVCGVCHAKNEHVDDFPFVNRCESCGVEPKAYQCHHKDCKKVIFLTDDELLRNYAVCINPPVELTEEEVEHADFEKKKRQKNYKLSLTNLDIDVKKAEQKYNETERMMRSPQEKIEESWTKRRAHTISAAEIFRREKATNEKNFKDDPEMLKWANEALTEWYESGDWERIV